ncbi:MAG: hypothetical protein CR990_00255 [Desulfococcus sp.]|nr:MAG: hypothetical protein CR990_00255 [Desulfococcus sp.]
MFPDPRRSCRQGLLREVGLAVLIGAAIIGGYHGLVTASFLSARDIAMSGLVFLEREDILEQAGVWPGINLPGVNTDLVERRLEAHPWICRAEVRVTARRTLDIRIEEYTPLAVVAVGRDWLIDQSGNIFKAYEPGADPGGLPRVTGLSLPDLGIRALEEKDGEERAPGFSRSFNAVMNMLQFLRQPDSVPILRSLVRIHADEAVGITLHLIPSPEFLRLETVRMGFFDYEIKLNRLKMVLNMMRGEGTGAALSTVDLTNPGSVTVTPAGIPKEG